MEDNNLSLFRKIKYESCFKDGALEGNIANKQVTETIYRQRNILETIFRLLDTDNSGFKPENKILKHVIAL